MLGSASVTLYLSFWGHFLSEGGAHQFVYTPASDLPAYLPLCSQHWGYKHPLSYLAFNIGARDLNSGPLVCVASTLLTEPPALSSLPLHTFDAFGYCVIEYACLCYLYVSHHHRLCCLRTRKVLFILLLWVANTCRLPEEQCRQKS